MSAETIKSFAFSCYRCGVRIESAEDELPDGWRTMYWPSLQRREVEGGHHIDFCEDCFDSFCVWYDAVRSLAGALGAPAGVRGGQPQPENGATGTSEP